MEVKNIEANTTLADPMYVELAMIYPGLKAVKTDDKNTQQLDMELD